MVLRRFMSKTNETIFPILLAGFLLNLTIFVKGIPVIFTINKNIGGDMYEPTSEAIFVQGTLFVIRSCVKFVVLNYGGAMSDYVGRKPVAIIATIPSILGDLLLLSADITAPVVYIVGALMGLFSVAIPALRAWVCDLVEDEHTVTAQGSFRGITIGAAIAVGLPLGFGVSILAGPEYAYVISLAANIGGMLVVAFTTRDDTLGIIDHPAVISSPPAAPMVTITKRHWPTNWKHFLVHYSPWQGFYMLLELPTPVPQLWACYFLTLSANESYIHTLLNYMLLGAGFPPVVAAIGFLVTGACYAVVTERMLQRYGDIDSNYYGMSLSVVITSLVALCSFWSYPAFIMCWFFLLILPFDCSHAGINGLITRLYPINRQGEVQGVLEQLGTLAVLGGYPGTLLFTYFVGDSSPIYWSGPQFALSAFYSGIAVLLYVFYALSESGRVKILPNPDAKQKRMDTNDENNTMENSTENLLHAI